MVMFPEKVLVAAQFDGAGGAIDVQSAGAADRIGDGEGAGAVEAERAVVRDVRCAERAGGAVVADLQRAAVDGGGAGVGGVAGEDELAGAGFDEVVVVIVGAAAAERAVEEVGVGIVRDVHGEGGGGGVAVDDAVGGAGAVGEQAADFLAAGVHLEGAAVCAVAENQAGGDGQAVVAAPIRRIPWRTRVSP